MAINNPVITDSEWLQATAVAIQNKDGGSKMEVPDFASRIENIPTGGGTLIPKTITENGVYNASSDNADGYDIVTVDVLQDPNENFDKFMNGQMVRIRSNSEFILRHLVFGNGGANSLSYPNVKYIEFPRNNIDPDRAWQFSHMAALIRLDVGFMPIIRTSLIVYSHNFKFLILRKNDTCVSLPNKTNIGTYESLRIYVPDTLVNQYPNETNWSDSRFLGKFRPFYIANSNSELDTLLNDSSIANESMIICDYNETYVIKGEGVLPND